MNYNFSKYGSEKLVTNFFDFSSRSAILGGNKFLIVIVIGN